MLFTFYYYVKQIKDLNLHKLIKWALKNPDQKTPKISKFGVKTEKENKNRWINVLKQTHTVLNCILMIRSLILSLNL